MDERKSLIKKIFDDYIGDTCHCDEYLYEFTIEEIADLILADRKRIVEPLVEYKNNCKEPWGYPKSHNAIDKALKLSGTNIDFDLI